MPGLSRTDARLFLDEIFFLNQDSNFAFRLNKVVAAAFTGGLSVKAMLDKNRLDYNHAFVNLCSEYGLLREDLYPALDSLWEESLYATAPGAGNAKDRFAEGLGQSSHDADAIGGVTPALALLTLISAIGATGAGMYVAAVRRMRQYQAAVNVYACTLVQEVLHGSAG